MSNAVPFSAEIYEAHALTLAHQQSVNHVCMVARDRLRRLGAGGSGALARHLQVLTYLAMLELASRLPDSANDGTVPPPNAA